ncbi:hypothetical protein Sango_1327900 [Sesamum angolense]|uniref:NEP1-interacting protein 1 n=1 Tax=Sesamum angolense TaxID=2727404 RepID=A0AAE2BUR4_9LAMI|nr:hypothetical protein Sango_1327900 [Sesamum angolense]
MWASTVSSWVCRELSGSQSGFLFGLLKKFAVALLTCVFALGGATVGVISGAIKGQTTETGLLRGFGVGAVAGGVTGVQLMELILNGEPFSKVALICSLVNGKIFMEWVSPAVLKAYQWQISTMETGLREISDILRTSRMENVQGYCQVVDISSTCTASTNGLPGKPAAQYAERTFDGNHKRKTKWKTSQS